MGPLPSHPRRIAWLLALVAVVSFLACGRKQAAPRELILATTTSTLDTGLLQYLLADFERSRGTKVKVVAVGTGEALAMGARGDADLLLVHARAAEDEFMAKGLGALRLDVMHNDFVLVGPGSDPAGARGQAPAEAFRKIAASGSTFASRGDRSGTHLKEKELWKAAGVDASPKPWLLSTGQGMGETARIATEKQAYTLMDRGTWLSMQATLKLQLLSQSDPLLDNPYGVIVVSARKFPHVREEEATAMARWLVTAETQHKIGQFGRDQYGQSLFVPDALAEVKR